VRPLWPDTPPPLDDERIAEALERPVGQPPIRELARGKSRPLIIVDDLTRASPTARVIPHLLRHLEAAGIDRRDVTILMATGTHGPPGPGGVEKKAGPEASAACRLLVHQHSGNAVRIGRTSFGTPVFVNDAVAASDLVVGVGGVYPQNSTGFGGGSKLALGVLARRTIARLHFGHPSMKGSYEIENDFRRDLDEIARMIGLHTTVALHVDANREPVRIVSGDHNLYYRDAVAFSRDRYGATLPGDADVVICNAYPGDVSLTMMRIKGIIPLLHAKPGASKVLIAACPEGVGHHDLFPFIGGPRFARQRGMARSAAAHPGAVPRKAARKLLRRIARTRSGGRGTGPSAPPRSTPIRLYVPGDGARSMPAEIPQMTQSDTWEDALEAIAREQGHRSALDVALYPCAPLHVLDLSLSEAGGPELPADIAI
jgi:lactate racemase